jgi:carbamoyltransferase
MSKIIGIHYGGHDSSTALIIDGKVVYAMEEEKFTGRKAIYDYWSYPKLGLKFIEENYGVTIENCDHVTFALPRKMLLEHDYMKYSNKFSSYSHHKCHALGAYYTSGFEGKTIAISLDGQGNRSRGKIYLCDGNDVELIYSSYIPTTSSLAGLWGLATQSLGWKMFKDEGKVVGLAAHGVYNERIYNLLKKCFYYKGNFEFGPNNFNSLYEYIFDKKLKSEGFFDDKKNKRDFAYNLQIISEETMGEFLKELNEKYPEYKQITFGGGLFANVKLNQFINNLGYFDNIYIHPSMGDGGLALGAAICKAVDLGEINKPLKLKNVFFGSKWSKENWLDELSKVQEQVELYEFSYEKTAELIHDGNVCGLFFDRTEYGPRALGNRSIVVRPTDKDTHKRLNEKLKRTEIMPFAPSVLSEYSEDIFMINKSKHTMEFMTMCTDTFPSYIEKLPAVIHEQDFSARPQLVDKENNPNFYKIISEYHKLSGIPVVLNTSFNAHGEPINNYPNQVINHLLDNSVDYIITEYFIIKKKIWN